MDAGKTVDGSRVKHYVFLARERLAQARKLGAPEIVLDRATRYLADAEYYHSREDYVTALASVNYSHGLLDGALEGTAARLTGLLPERKVVANILVNGLRGDRSIASLAASLCADVDELIGVLEGLRAEGLLEILGEEVGLTPTGRGKIKVGLVAGVFDLIHPGHVAFLDWAKGRVDVLTAIIARDPNSARRKGRAPVQSESDRLTVVSHLDAVDYCCLGDQEDTYSPVLRIGPDIIFLGKDQEADARRIKAELARRGLKVQVTRSRVWDSGDLSKTSRIIDQIRKRSSGRAWEEP